MLLLSSHPVFNHIIAQHSTSPHTLLTLVTSYCQYGIDQIYHLCLFHYSSFFLPSFLIPFLPSFSFNPLLITHLLFNHLLIILLHFTSLHFSLLLSYLILLSFLISYQPLWPPFRLLWGWGQGRDSPPLTERYPPPPLPHTPYHINTHIFVCISVYITAAEFNGFFFSLLVWSSILKKCKRGYFTLLL